MNDQKNKLTTGSNAGNKLINIRPKTDIYNFFKRLPYTFEQVIYELIDNSIDSFWKNSETLKSTEERFRLKINIIWDQINNQVIIEDNAFGMDWESFERAFVLNVPPNDISYKSEFGLGLKTAACWLGGKYTIITSKLGSDKEFSATLDSEFLKETKEENLKVQTREIEKKTHYSIIIIEDLRKTINDYFWSILTEKITKTYCFDIEELKIEIRHVKLLFDENRERIFEFDSIEYENIEKAPVLITRENKKILKDKEGKELKSEFVGKVKIEGREISFKGNIILLETMKHSETDLFFYRRGRLIIGNEKPYCIFGDGSSHFSKRCRVTLWVDYFPVSFNKSSFNMSDEEIDSFEKILDEIIKGKNKTGQNLKSIANKHRKERKKQSDKIKETEESKVDEGNSFENNKRSEQSQSKQEPNNSIENASNVTEKSSSLHVDHIINNNLNNYLELYKVEENRMSIQINKKKFLENYVLLQEDEKWYFFEKMLVNIINSVLFLKLTSNYLWKDSDVTSEFLENINKSFRNSNKK